LISLIVILWWKIDRKVEEEEDVDEEERERERMITSHKLREVLSLLSSEGGFLLDSQVQDALNQLNEDEEREVFFILN